MWSLLAVVDWNLIFTPPGIFGLGGIAIGIVAIVTPQWRRVQQTSALTRLIRDTVDRGFSADEIERILKTGTWNDQEQPGNRTGRADHGPVVASTPPQ